MPRTRYEVGDRVEVYCYHLREGKLVRDWAPGEVISVDHRMAEIRCEPFVYTALGMPADGRVLWCAHGSPRLRRAGEPAAGE